MADPAGVVNGGFVPGAVRVFIGDVDGRRRHVDGLAAGVLHAYVVGGEPVTGDGVGHRDEAGVEIVGVGPTIDGPDAAGVVDVDGAGGELQVGRPRQALRG